MLNYVDLLSQFPPKLATFLIAMLPIAELRVSFPLAIGVFKLSIFSAYFLSVVGNLLPIIFILWFLEPVSNFLTKRFQFADKFFKWLFKRTRNRFKDKYKKYGEYALILFVAIPLPVTGAWTGSVASFLFGIPPKRAFVFISLGVVLSGIIVGIISIGSLSLL